MGVDLAKAKLGANPRPISLEDSAVVGRRDHLLFGFIKEKSGDAQNYSDSSSMRSQIFQRADRQTERERTTDQSGREATHFRSYEREREREREHESMRNGCGWGIIC